MATRRVIGIDFGSSQSFVSELEIGSTEVPSILELGNPLAEMIPTLLAYDKEDDTRVAFGNEVRERCRKFPHETYVVRNFKRYLAEKLGEEAGSHVAGMPADDYVAEFISLLADALRLKYNQKVLSEDDFEVCMAYPATWDRDEAKKEKLKELARLAKLPGVHAIPEPIAAVHAMKVEEGLAHANKPEKYMVIDFGGGTLDICVIQVETLGRSPHILSTAGDGKLGGADFDKIFEMAYERDSKLSIAALPENERWELREECKRAKEACSVNFNNAQNKTYTHPFKTHKQVELTISRTQLENLCEDQGIFRRIEACIDDAMKEANIACADIAKVILTGGSSQWYFMREMVAKKFGIFGGDIYLTKTPCMDVCKGTALYVGRPAAPPLKPGIWFKWRFVGENDDGWSTPKQLLAPTEKEADDNLETTFIAQLGKTKNLTRYKIEFMFLIGKTEREMKEAFRSKLYIYARSNWPRFGRFRRMVDAFCHSDKTVEPFHDKYDLYLQCKPSPGGHEYTYEMKSSSGKIMKGQLIKNGITKPNFMEFFGLGSYSISSENQEG